jgi:hypothetical protein
MTLGLFVEILTNFLPGLTLSHDLPQFHLQSRWESSLGNSWGQNPIGFNDDHSVPTANC